MDEAVDIAQQFERHLSSPKQTWLLGAGVSFLSNVPLMAPLTDRVLSVARSVVFAADNEALRVLDFVERDIPKTANIELFLTHLGDLTSLAERSRAGGTLVKGTVVAKAKLTAIHNALLQLISDTVRWGYRPAIKGVGGAAGEPEIIGQAGKPITDVNAHQKFVQAVFSGGRAGLERHRGPVNFFTTNYDTLLEDALALEAIDYFDCFGAGGVAAWRGPGREHPDCRASVTKLHGSIDWYRSDVAPSRLLRVRHDDAYPKRAGGAVMIYPQSTKYMNSQLDPFASLFQHFRQRLSDSSDHVLLVCGYSFSDDHIDADIEAAMQKSGNKLTLVAFSAEPDGRLPAKLRAWKSLKGSWGGQVYVASPKGLYRGDVGPVFPAAVARDWWTFGGMTKLLSEGLPKDVAEAIA